MPIGTLSKISRFRILRLIWEVQSVIPGRARNISDKLMEITLSLFAFWNW
jgi:hypothetical protein